MRVYSDEAVDQSFRNLDLHQAVNCIIYGHSTNREDIRDFALGRVDFSAVRNILDLGCGFGFSTLGLKDKITPAAHIVGIDIQEAYQKAFIQACESIGATGEFHASDVAELSTYPAHSFDLVFSCFSLYFFPDVVQDVARVLTATGTFVAVTHSQETLRELIRHIPPALQSLGIRVPDLLSIQRLLRTFSAETGERLLRPWFEDVRREVFPNTLRFKGDELPQIQAYLQMKRQLLLQEVCEASPDSVGAALNQILTALAAEAQHQGSLEFNKDDAVFICRQPTVARTERVRPASPRFCSACGSLLVERKIEGRRRALCTDCGYVAYENPLPVVAAVVVNRRREVLLVRRARHPMKGMWCLPCGFAESDERIEDAVCRELAEETHLRGRVRRLLDAVTARNYFYGNLVMISFEMCHFEGNPVAGDDADAVAYFPIDRMPPLAFPCQTQAVDRYRELHP